jgi:hypothetical protein
VVSVRNGTWSWTLAGAVVVMARATDCGTECGSYEATCPNTVFHASLAPSEGNFRMNTRPLLWPVSVTRHRVPTGTVVSSRPSI